MEFSRVLLFVAGLFFQLMVGSAIAQDNPWQIRSPTEFRETYSGSGLPGKNQLSRGQFAPENYSTRGYWRESGDQRSPTNEQYGNEQRDGNQVFPTDNSGRADGRRYRDQNANRQQGVPAPQASGDGNSIRSRGEHVPNSANAHATDPEQQDRQNRGQVYGEFAPLNHGAEMSPVRKFGRDGSNYSDSGSRGGRAFRRGSYPQGFGGYYQGMARPPMPGIGGPSTFGNPYGGLGGMYVSPFGPGFPGGW